MNQLKGALIDNHHSETKPKDPEEQMLTVGWRFICKKSFSKIFIFLFSSNFAIIARFYTTSAKILNLCLNFTHLDLTKPCWWNYQASFYDWVVRVWVVQFFKIISNKWKLVKLIFILEFSDLPNFKPVSRINKNVFIKKSFYSFIKKSMKL